MYSTKTILLSLQWFHTISISHIISLHLYIIHGYIMARRTLRVRDSAPCG